MSRPLDPMAGVPPEAVAALVEGRHGDAFALLGPHEVGGRRVVRAFFPGATAVEAVDEGGSRIALLPEVHGAGVFAGPIGGDAPYRLRVRWADAVQETADPYAFGLLLGELDLHLLREGTHYELGRCLGAQCLTAEGVPGVRFAVWAPNARRVSVVGDFNMWDGRRHPMRLRPSAGIWELFVPGLGPGARYKYELLDRDGRLLPLKADPVARASEPAPATASVVARADPFVWDDEAWMAQRAARNAADAPIAIYEVHAGSWLRMANEGDRSLTWAELAERLVPYVAGMGFTHVELMPIMEHPFGGSWGYQPLGLFAPTARHGSAEDFAFFVDTCHRAGIGVILDWVPAHFPADVHGLARFDGTALYEHEDPREGFHPDWNTLIYNLGRREVKGFLIASAFEWLERYHVDGLRVDAVAAMLYRDYSRKPGEWVPNAQGGRENLEAVEFFRHLNSMIATRCPGALVAAEESTAWPGVTAPVEQGGLGFGYKWNMGWMHDTLGFMAQDPIHRRYHHHAMTFGMVYADTERFILPLSHDEVVHGKGALLAKMPGDGWQRHANLRAYLAFMWAHPGKKLLFMGGEIGAEREWNHDGAIDWNLLDDPRHRGVQRLVRDLNALYATEPALHAREEGAGGFEWIIAHDAERSILAFLRRAGRDDGMILSVSNMTPVPRHGYRLDVPEAGRWEEILNSDALVYGGSDLGNQGIAMANASPAELLLTLPPLATIWLRHRPERGSEPR